MSQPTQTETSPDQFEPKKFVREMAPRMIVLAIMCVIVQSLMGLSYMGAFGKPEAKRAPFIVVSHQAGNAGYIANKLNSAPGEPVLATISTDEKAAIDKVKRDEAIGVYVFNPSLTDKNPTDHLYYASAQGASRVTVAQTVATKVADQAKRQLAQTDVVKTAPDDTRGTAPFYLVLAWLVGGYLLPSAMSTAVGTRARSALGARLRLALFAAYAVVSGLVGTAVAQYGLDALRGSYFLIALTGAALVFTVATFTYGLTSLFGTAGIGLSIIIFVILGNPSAGGAYNYDVLPEPWRAVGPYLPNGAGVDAVRSLSYFNGVQLERPTWVVLAWLVAGLWMVWMVGNNTYRFTRTHTSSADEGGVGLVGEYVEHKLSHHEAHGRDEADRNDGGYEGRHAERDDDVTHVDDLGESPSAGLESQGLSPKSEDV